MQMNPGEQITKDIGRTGIEDGELPRPRFHTSFSIVIGDQFAAILQYKP